jgi:hypothetical protein
MAVNIPSNLSYGQLTAALQALANSPQTAGAPGAGGVPVDGYTGATGWMPLQGPQGLIGAPSNLGGVVPAATTSVYDGFGAVANTGLNPSEQQMYAQLAGEDPAAAQKFLLQMKLQKIMELASLVSNMSKTRHSAAMGIIANTK